MKAVEIDADGTITRIEFLTPNDYDAAVAAEPDDDLVAGDAYPKLGARKN